MATIMELNIFISLFGAFMTLASCKPTSAPPPLPMLKVCQNLGANKFAERVQKTSYLRELIVNSTGFGGSVSAFAFTDEAFANAPQEVRDLSGQDLEWFLQYHFALGFAGDFGPDADYLYSSLFPLPLKPSLPLQQIRVNRYRVDRTTNKIGFGVFEKVLTASGAEIIKADIPASNGVVHLINKVMYPIPYGSNLPEFLADDPEFSTLTYFLKNATLEPNVTVISQLATPPSQPITLFAPTDAAFARLTKAQKEKLKDGKTLTKVLLYHVVNYALYHAGMYDFQKVEAFSGDTILVEKGIGGTYVDNVKMTYFDITVTNGVVHKLANVMFPPGM